MASTNKTTNYELSQYLGSDKPTYLGDYNSDMLKIDNAIHQNALNIATADEKATLAGTNASTALTNASNAQTTADTANSTATSALSKATANEASILSLEGINTYETTEQVVGTWIDGKPIYRKVFNNISLPKTAVLTSLNVGTISNPDKIIDMKGIMTSDLNVSYTGYVSNLVAMCPYINISDVKVEYIFERDGTKGLVIVEYTKTTD